MNSTCCKLCAWAGDLVQDTKSVSSSARRVSGYPLDFLLPFFAIVDECNKLPASLLKPSLVFLVSEDKVAGSFSSRLYSFGEARIRQDFADERLGLFREVRRKICCLPALQEV